MPTQRTTKVATVAKKVASKGNRLQRKAKTTARKIKKKATGTAAVASRNMRKVAKKAKPSAAARQARKLGQAVGGVIGQAIGTVEKAVTDIVTK